MVIISVGNVGIGTTHPTYKLDVKVNIRATGAIYGKGGRAALYEIINPYCEDYQQASFSPTCATKVCATKPEVYFTCDGVCDIYNAYNKRRYNPDTCPNTLRGYLH